MNYYPFHIGDYVIATRHLTWTEDAAYRRLLDTYYTTEKPLPAELRAVCRLVLASTDEQREAVQVVLDEFFELTDAGWINARADAEIDSMRVKQSAQEDKDRHETDRMRRYRERRAAMFSALRELEIVPAWDVPMKELQRLYDESRNATATQAPKKPETPPETPETEPATDLQREQAVSGDAPATAISTNTNTNTNTNKEGEGKVQRKRRTTTSTPECPDGVDQQVWSDWLTLRKAKSAPVTETVLGEAAKEAKKAGMALESFLKIWCMRGSQGLQADWIKPEERATVQAAGQYETPYQRSMRERIQEAAPDIARRAPMPAHQDAADFFRTIDAPARVVETHAIEVLP